MSSYVVTVAVAVVVLGFIIYQQIRERPLRDRQLVVVPIVLALLGLVNLQGHLSWSRAGLVLLTASMSVAVVFGLARGWSTLVFRSDSSGGRILRRGTPVTLGLWLASIAIRAGIGAVGWKASVPALCDCRRDPDLPCRYAGGAKRHSLAPRATTRRRPGGTPSRGRPTSGIGPCPESWTRLAGMEPTSAMPRYRRGVRVCQATPRRESSASSFFAQGTEEITGGSGTESFHPAHLGIPRRDHARRT